MRFEITFDGFGVLPRAKGLAGFLVSFLAIKVSPFASNSKASECFQKHAESNLLDLRKVNAYFADHLLRFGWLTKRQRLRGFRWFLLFLAGHAILLSTKTLVKV
jgi:hypothetical protein